MTFQQDEITPHLPPENMPSPTTPARPPREAWRLRDLLLFIAYAAGAFGVVLFFSLAVSVAYVILAPMVGWTTPIFRLQQNTVYLLAFQLVWYALLLAYIYFLVVFYYRLPFWQGLHWESLKGNRLLQFILGGVVLSLVVMLVPVFLPEKKSFPLEKMFSSPSSAYAIALFAVVFAPFMEELLFRGLLFAFFEKHGGLKFAVVATALLFVGLHVPEYWGAWQSLAMLLIVGFVFSLTRGKTGSVTPSYIMHMTYNGTQMLLFFFQTQHFHKFPGGPHV